MPKIDSIVRQSVSEKIRVKIIPVTLIATGVAFFSILTFTILSLQKQTTTGTITVSLPPAPDYELQDVSSSEAEMTKDAIKRLTVPTASQRTQEVGRPSIPLIDRLVLVPPDTVVQNVKLTVTDQQRRSVSVKILPVQARDLPDAKTEIQKIDGQDTVVFTDPLMAPDQTTYTTNAPYPAAALSGFKQGQWGNFDVVNVTYAPWQYNPGTNELIGLRAAQVEVTYQTKSTKLAKRGDLSRAYITAEAKRELLNPEQITTWYGSAGATSTAGSPINLAIIRPDYFLKDLMVASMGGQWIPGPTKGIFATSATNVWTAGYPQQHTNNMAYSDTWPGTADERIRAITLTAQENGQKAYLEGVAGLTNGTVVTFGYAADRAVIYTRLSAGDPLIFNQVTLPAAATGKKFYGLSFVDKTNSHSAAWVVGGSADNSSNIVFKATDVANLNSWSQIAVPATPSLRGVYVTTSGKVWAVGDQGTILYYNGSTWSTQPSGVTQNLRSVSGSGPSDIWAVGDAGVMLHYDGTAWQNVSSTNPDVYDNRLNVVKVFDSAHVFAAGDVDTFMKWEPVSSRWIHNYVTHLASYVPHEFQDISFINANEFVMVSVRDDGAPQLFYGSVETDTFNNYLSFRQNQGYGIEIKSLSEIIAGYTGDNLYERINAYLLDRYTNNGLTHVLLAGSARLVPNNSDHYPYGGDDSNKFRNLIGDDNTRELFVARIPRDDASEIQSYLQRVIDAESRSDPGLNNVLLTGDCYEGGDTLCNMIPGVMDWLKEQLFQPLGYAVTTLYSHHNQFGISSAQCSASSTDELSEQNVIQRWTTEHPYFVSMSAHGGPGGISNTWNASDADSLDNTFASHVANPTPCSTANPMLFDNIGSMLIMNGGISYLGAAQNVACTDYNDPVRYFENIIRNGQSISEAFNFDPVRGPQTLFGDPLAGYAGQQGRAISFYAPVFGDTLRGVNQINIIGSVLGAGLTNYVVEWGQGTSPASWSTSGVTLNNPTSKKIVDLLGTWDTSTITNTGPYTIRVTGTFSGQTASRQITLTIDNQACTDGTQPQMCSVTKPKFCEDGALQNRCSSCGCPNVGDTCTYTGSCIVGCVDGTLRNTCSNPVGYYCNQASQLITLQTTCASADRVAHTADDCNACTGPNQFCDTSGYCATGTEQYGLNGDYFEGPSFNTLKADNVRDPVIDFGPSFGGTYLASLISQRIGSSSAASIRWEGFINIATAEPITYYLNSSAPAKLYIDSLSAPIISVTMPMGTSVSKSFAIGWHPIKIEFQRTTSFDSGGLQFGWKVGGGDYPAEMGGQTFGIKLNYIVPQGSLAPTIPVPNKGGGCEDTNHNGRIDVGECLPIEIQ